MKAYKGFDDNFCCRGFQYEVGKTYRIPDDEIIGICKNGFHACTSPIDVLNYYSPYRDTLSRFAEVEIEGDICFSQGKDSKICGREITILRELTLKELIDIQIHPEKGTNRTVEKDRIIYNKEQQFVAITNEEIFKDYKIYVASSADTSFISRDFSALINQESYSSAVSTGVFNNVITMEDYSYAVAANRKMSMDNAVAFNDYSIAVALGSGGVKTAITYGESSPAITDSNAAIAIGDCSEAIGLGRSSKAIAYGDCGIAITTGLYGSAEVKGEQSIAANLCEGGVACAKTTGSWLILTNEDVEGNLIVKTIKIDNKEYFSNVFYKLDETGCVIRA
ncbi:MAG: hypothetical protein LUC37_06025 [Prevotella sp.]|nr:hypothetical protein [Prevotella sp.]